MHLTVKGMALLPLTNVEARVVPAFQYIALLLADMRLTERAGLQRCQQV